MNNTTSSKKAKTSRGLKRLGVALVVSTSLVAAYGIDTAVAGEGREIHIGASIALSGKHEKPGSELLNGYKMWVEEVNARGGLLGRQVKLIYENDESDGVRSAEIYERLITQEKVNLLLGPYSSGITIKASAVADSHNFPILTTTAASDKVWDRGMKNVFGSISPASTWMYPVITYANQQGLRKVAFMFAESAFPKSIIQGAKKKAMDLGMSVVYEGSYPKKSTEFTEIVANMKAASPDVIIGGTHLPDSIAFLRQAKSGGLNAKLLAFTVGPTFPSFGKDLGDVAEGVMAPSPWEPTLGFPGVAEFVKRYESKHGYKPGSHAGIGYGGGNILEAAVKKAGSLDKNKLRWAFSELQTTTTLGNYAVNKAGANTAMSTYVIQWSGGEKRIVLPTSTAKYAVNFPRNPW